MTRTTLETIRREIGEAACPRCRGNGYVGHMGIGHDGCPVCDGTGTKPDRNIMRMAYLLLHEVREGMGVDIADWRLPAKAEIPPGGE